MRIDQDIRYQDDDRIPSTNEPLGCYPIQISESELKHDDKGKNDMEQDDDEYVSDGINQYYPTDTSIPVSNDRGG